MRTDAARLQYLLERLHQKTASPEEVEELKQLLACTDEELEGRLQSIWEHTPAQSLFFTSATSETMLDNILRTAPVELPAPSRLHKRRLFMAAAALLLLSLTSVWWYIQFEKRPADQPLAKGKPAMVLPGGDKAELILDDGTTILLDSSQNGLLSQQGKVKVIKAGGRLSYDNQAAGEGTAIAYNTLRTPRGGQYMLQLEDGSQVWLNAASSVRYPTVFSKKERVVELTGEAYLEVAKNAERPFIVKVRGMEIQVLGTQFNVNAYADELTISTTLVEGSIKITRPGKEPQLLKPGQQAQLDAQGELHMVNEVDVDAVVAWKNGLFQFNRADVYSVMRQIARWYDVDVAFEGNIPGRQFGGKISRNSSVQEVLKVLELSKVHFRMQGRTIVVTP